MSKCGREKGPWHVSPSGGRRRGRVTPSARFGAPLPSWEQLPWDTGGQVRGRDSPPLKKKSGKRPGPRELRFACVARARPVSLAREGTDLAVVVDARNVRAAGASPAASRDWAIPRQPLEKASPEPLKYYLLSNVQERRGGERKALPGSSTTCREPF